MSERKRIALYGGTFDPVHNGHLAVAQNVLRLFALDELLFIPAHIAPHKRERSVSAGLMRYAMLALATQSEERLRISSIELDAPERPYTIDTLARLQEQLGPQARLFFMMGADSWADITTWREWERLLLACDHIVITRPGYEFDAGHVTETVRERLVDLRGASTETVARQLSESAGMKIYLTDAVLMDVSATEIRRAAREGRAAKVRELVPPPVADFIRKYGLYTEREA
ncbi:MAG TPA: nicotinate-nucleotide adenylyltransferase [Pyrinomonadaceae bacterium]|jgi:nicotinate-nucleotide adenylyltransferase|nr:nicotinate-nucleotide adenylyltransferase [Pyrinomonadaceae bacterium]